MSCCLSLPIALVTAGCSHEHKTEVTHVSDPPTVQVLKPELRNITRVVGQPSFVEAYERTSIYPKLSGYIEKWYVDIGDKVTKGQVLCDLFVPEVKEDCETKKAQVELDKQRVELAKKIVLVADADVRSAEARLKAAIAIRAQYDAQVVRWDSEVKRLKREVGRGVVDPQVLLESENQLRASTAAREAADADIAKAQADLESKTASLREDEVAVAVAEADVDVATSDWKRMEAWVGYLKLYAPFDGVVVARNANTGDFVLPAKGDPTAEAHSPNLSPSGEAAPIYVIDRTDVVRIFVDIPEHDANFVHVGTQATVLAKAFRDQPVIGTVTRTSWALNVKSRTLRAEIDLPNTDSKIPDDLPAATREALRHVKLPNTNSQILPGMYAYGKVIIDRPNVRALPVSALTYSGDRTYYWSHVNGKAMRVEVQTGVSDGQWIEVTNRLRRPAIANGGTIQNVIFKQEPDGQNAPPQALAENESWVPFDGSEEVILGDLSVLTDGAPVRLGNAAGIIQAAPGEAVAAEPLTEETAQGPKSLVE
ncbi:MAG TPA: efflux RND transporter periplasmic adaptor subunit [Pirellulales bacterium]|nr:efflux RND transporter periplasmic adaptor subunit [Pirellulales bacterium]